MSDGRNRYSAPRSIRGGRSARYDERRLERGVQRAYAPAWSDASAHVIMAELHAAASANDRTLLDTVVGCLTYMLDRINNRDVRVLFG